MLLKNPRKSWDKAPTVPSTGELSLPGCLNEPSTVGPPHPTPMGPHLEDHPRTCKWLGSPPFISHKTPIWKGNHPILRGLTITMVINHLLNGMILQACCGQQGDCVKSTTARDWIRWNATWYLPRGLAFAKGKFPPCLDGKNPS